MFIGTQFKCLRLLIWEGSSAFLWIQADSPISDLPTFMKVGSLRGLLIASIVSLCRPPDEQNDHKVTCGVRADVLTTVLNHIESIITANNVKAKLITSGEGDWRYFLKEL